MKKQINSVSIWSVKSGFKVTVLCALLGATEVNASNNLSFSLNSDSKGIKTEVKDENVTSRNNTSWVSGNSDLNVQEQVTAVITQWMSDGSYWSSDDSLLYDPKASPINEKVLNNDQPSDDHKIENESGLINAKSYIAGFKF